MRPHRQQPSRLPCPWDSPGRNTEVGCISFSNAWKWKVKVKSLSRVRLLVTPWTAAYQAPPSIGFSRQENWSGLPLPSPIMVLWLQAKYTESDYLKAERNILEKPGTAHRVKESKHNILSKKAHWEELQESWWTAKLCSVFSWHPHQDGRTELFGSHSCEDSKFMDRGSDPTSLHPETIL